MKKLTYLINGKNYTGNDYIDIISPLTNTPFMQVPALKKENIDEVYQSAEEAKKEWQAKTISERGKYLNKWAELLLENQEDLANILVEEIAKNYNDAITEIQRTAEYINYTVEEALRIEINAASSEQYYNGNRNKIALTKRVPVGIVLAISPFNYPVNLSIAKIAPALIMGNTVVFKPATQGTVVGIEIVKLLLETGINNKVLNIVTGRGRDIGDYIVAHEKANFISFTGGTATGKHISQLAVMTPQVMELGGKDAAIVLEDADLTFAARDIVAGGFNYSGQRCTAVKRIFVHESQKEELTKYLIEEVEKLSVGNPKENNVIVPLISEASANYVEELIEDAKKQGSEILTGGKREGNLIYPTLITNVKRTDRIAIEEPFGPVIPILTYKNEAEVIEMNNESSFGLQTSVYGKDINNLIKLGEKLDSGTINFNGKPSRGPDNFPFAGRKDSGMGVQGIRESIMSMTLPKTYVLNIL